MLAVVFELKKEGRLVKNAPLKIRAWPEILAALRKSPPTESPHQTQWLK